MALLAKLKTINRLISSWVERIGICAFLLIMGITWVDVVRGKIFNEPILGSIDMVMLAQLLAISFAASMMVILRRHIQVEFMVVLLPNRLRNIIQSITSLVCFTFFVLLVWRLFVFAHSFQTGGEVTPTAYIPIFPFVYSAAVAFIPGCLGYFQQCIEEIIKVVKNEP